jgi:hypothetical protein
MRSTPRRLATMLLWLLCSATPLTACIHLPAPPAPQPEVIVRSAKIKIADKDRACLDDPGKPSGDMQSDAARWSNKIHEALIDCKTKLSVVVGAIDAANSTEVGSQ